MDIPQDEYQTKNLFLAAYLMASDKVEFLGLKTLDYKTKLFRFSPKAKAEKLVAEYFSGGKLPVKIVFAEYNNLKDMLFQVQGEPNGGNYGEKS